jgi:hypothetical protein
MRYRTDLDALVKSLNLPKDQASKLLADLKRYRAQQEELEKAHAARVKKLDKQFRPVRKQREKLRRQMQDMKARQAKLGKSSTDQLNPKPLTSEGDLRGWESHKLFRSFFHEYRRARLTPDQQKRLQSLCEKEAKKLAAASPVERGKAELDAQRRMRQGMDKLLTNEQHETMTSVRVEDEALKAMQGVRLTGEQYRKLQSLCTDAAKKLLHKPGKVATTGKPWYQQQSVKRKIVTDLTDSIRKKVLTREQRKQLEAAPGKAKAPAKATSPKVE